MRTRKHKKNELDRFFAEMPECCVTATYQCEECLEDDEEEEASDESEA